MLDTRQIQDIDIISHQLPTAGLTKVAANVEYDHRLNHIALFYLAFFLLTLFLINFLIFDET